MFLSIITLLLSLLSFIVLMIIVFRKKDNKARDIFDIAVAIIKDKNILSNLLTNERVRKEDLEVFQDALQSINMQKYKTAIDLIEPAKNGANRTPMTLLFGHL